MLARSTKPVAAETSLYWFEELVQFTSLGQTRFREVPMRTQGWAELYAWQLDREERRPAVSPDLHAGAVGVLAGVLAPGTGLPSTRVMAKMLGVARASVVAAYEQLWRKAMPRAGPDRGRMSPTDLAGLIARPARGSLVRQAAPIRPPGASLRRVRAIDSTS